MPFRVLLSSVLLLGFVSVIQPATASTKENGRIGRMSIETLAAKLDDPAIAILDVRTGSSWTDVTEQIPGSLRLEPRKASMWASKLDPSKHYVLYCT